ncbi:MAG: hypothetical protein ACI837_003264 [Crocinitomicaceae bacterium]|jgi:hypothetical protein
MKLIVFLILSFATSSSISQDVDQIDTLIQKKVKELQVKELVITLIKDDTSYINEIRRYNHNGQMIEHLLPPKDFLYRSITRYDSLGRRTHSFDVNKEDSTLFDSEEQWTYTDSNRYHVDQYTQNHELYRTTKYIKRVNGDTSWVIELQIDYINDTKTKHLARYTQVGDTLLVSEFVTFDDKGKMSSISAYYDLKKIDTSGNLIHTDGTYMLKDEVWDQFRESREMRNDYEQNPEKYIRRQLKGEYEYEYEYFPYKYEVYNSKGQLIQDGTPYNGKTTLEYNQTDQLIKSTSWSSLIEHNVPIEIGITTYEYYENGLPKMIIHENLKRNWIKKSRYEYHY